MFLINQQPGFGAKRRTMEYQKKHKAGMMRLRSGSPRKPKRGECSIRVKLSQSLSYMRARKSMPLTGTERAGKGVCQRMKATTSAGKKMYGNWIECMCSITSSGNSLGFPTSMTFDSEFLNR